MEGGAEWETVCKGRRGARAGGGGEQGGRGHAGQAACRHLRLLVSYARYGEEKQQVRVGVTCWPRPFPAPWDLRAVEDSPPPQPLVVVLGCEMGVPGRLENGPGSCCTGGPVRDLAPRGISCWGPDDPYRGPYRGPGPAWSGPARMTGLPSPVALQGNSKAMCHWAVQPPTPTGERLGSFVPAWPPALCLVEAGLAGWQH